MATNYLKIAREATRQEIRTPQPAEPMTAKDADVGSGTPTDAQELWNAAIDLLEDDPSFPQELIPGMRAAKAHWNRMPPPKSVEDVWCDRCGYLAVVDVPIHNGQSTRRDCARCRRFRCFPKWYGKNLTRIAK
ncbi:hypothetical protein OAS39_01760 [Pirellulales bacterium]|nr:hypothetical protein [Pirellulales bacterium]